MTQRKEEKMKKLTENPSVFRHLWKSMLALGLVTLTLGVVVLIWPGKSVVVAGALFGAYLLASGIAQAIAAFTVHVPGSSRVLLFLSGVLSVVLGVFAFHDFNNGAAVWILATWIGVGFIFQGVAETVLAINHKELPERGWYIFVGVLSVLAGMVVIAWPISSTRDPRDRRRRMAGRHWDRTNCVGPQGAQGGHQCRASCRLVDAEHRQLTHRSAG